MQVAGREKIPDIERNGFNFSDGCGLISPALAEKANHPLPYHNIIHTSQALFFVALATFGVIAGT